MHKSGARVSLALSHALSHSIALFLSHLRVIQWYTWRDVATAPDRPTVTSCLRQVSANRTSTRYTGATTAVCTRDYERNLFGSSTAFVRKLRFVFHVTCRKKILLGCKRKSLLIEILESYILKMQQTPQWVPTGKSQRAADHLKNPHMYSYRKNARLRCNELYNYGLNQIKQEIL